MDGYVFDYDAPTRTFYVVCRLRTDTSLPRLIATIGAWNKEQVPLRTHQHAHRIFPERTTGGRWVLPVSIKELEKQLETNPILRRVKEASAPKERRKGGFVCIEDLDEPSPRTRYSPVERFLLPLGRAY